MNVYVTFIDSAYDKIFASLKSAKDYIETLNINILFGENYYIEQFIENTACVFYYYRNSTTKDFKSILIIKQELEGFVSL